MGGFAANRDYAASNSKYHVILWLLSRLSWARLTPKLDENQVNLSRFVYAGPRWRHVRPEFRGVYTNWAKRRDNLTCPGLCGFSGGWRCSVGYEPRPR